MKNIFLFLSAILIVQSVSVFAEETEKRDYKVACSTVVANRTGGSDYAKNCRHIKNNYALGCIQRANSFYSYLMSEAFEACGKIDNQYSFAAVEGLFNTYTNVPYEIIEVVADIDTVDERDCLLKLFRMYDGSLSKDKMKSCVSSFLDSLNPF